MKIDVDQRFNHHAPTGGKQAMHEDVRAAYKILATIVVDIIPESREQSLAVTALEESLFWANAAIARNPIT